MPRTELIDENLKLCPNLPGVYLMKDKSGEIIYIGKAKNLKKRVSSYFAKKHVSSKLKVMVPKINTFEFIVTDTEVEALILESHLIKKHQPKYNVLLKDDKKYPWFLITQEKYPRIMVIRRNKETPKGKLFGPYTNIGAMYATLDLIKKLFPLKQCKQPKFRDRPCLYHQIGKCSAPCQGLISPKDYQKLVDQVELFLSGKQEELVKKLKKQMEYHAQKQEFEKAAKYRDSFMDVTKVIERQKVVTQNTNVFQDVIGFDNDKFKMSITLLKIRKGRLIEKQNFDVDLNEIHNTKEALESFLKEYYQIIDISDIPKEVIIQEQVEEQDIIEEWISIKAKKKVKLTTPQKGKKLEMIEMAIKNATLGLEKLKLKELNKIETDFNEIGSYIQEKLKLTQFPHRVECFDISHIQGSNTVASMVVFINGKAKKSEYRKFKIREAEGKPDDFKSMQEVIKRRYSRLIKDGKDLPDLIIVDGGKGQLSSAKEILDELGLFEQNIVSLAKKLEEVFIPNRKTSVLFPTSSKALFFFQQIRDEAHRFAITYHRKLREKSSLKSALDDIEGIGIKKKQILLEYFKDFKGVMSANRSELERVLGKATGYKVYNYLHK